LANALNMAGRALGAMCGVAIAAAWAVAIWFPEAGLPLAGITVVVALLMLLLAVVGIIASVHGHALVLIVVFSASFVPVGLMLLDLDNWFRWIGGLNLGFLLAGLLVWGSARRRSRDRSPERTG
jgi:hypothetical protein